LFWSIFEQAGSTLNLFADRSTDTHLFGFAFPSSWFQSLNSGFIYVLGPLLAWLWIKLGDRDPSLVTKFAFGLLGAGGGFLYQPGNLSNVALYLFGGAGLLGGGGGDLGDHFPNFFRHFDNLHQRSAGQGRSIHSIFNLLGALVHGVHRVLCLQLDGLDHFPNLFCRGGCALSKFSDFVRNYGKSPSLFPGACRFDGSI